MDAQVSALAVLVAARFVTGQCERRAHYRVPPNYDSLVCKLLVHRPTRAQAIATLRRALDEFIVEGIQTTIPLHRRIVDDAAFQSGQMDTTYIERCLLKS